MGAPMSNAKPILGAGYCAGHRCARESALAFGVGKDLLVIALADQLNGKRGQRDCMGVALFVRAPGKRQSRCFRSSSPRIIPATSPTLWPVTRQSLMMRWHCSDRASACGKPFHKVRISSSDKTRSRGFDPGGLRIPSIGLWSRSPRETAHRNIARRSSKERMASVGALRFATLSITRVASLRWSSESFTLPMTGTMLR